MAGGGGVTTFTGLTDTPANYTSQAGKMVAVNSGETAVEFLDSLENETAIRLYDWNGFQQPKRFFSERQWELLANPSGVPSYN